MANLQAVYTQQRHRRALGGASLRTGHPRQATYLAVLNSYDLLRSLQRVEMHQVSGRLLTDGQPQCTFFTILSKVLLPKASAD